MITIQNIGQDIGSTNYWESEHANVGLCYVSGNAGALRLLVPEAAEGMLPEMRTGGSVTIEASIAHPSQCVDVVFEDGTDAPFALSIDRRQLDRALTLGDNVPFTVWTARGKQMAFLASVKTT
jgi:hypothetical protein